MVKRKSYIILYFQKVPLFMFDHWAHKTCRHELWANKLPSLGSRDQSNAIRLAGCWFESWIGCSSLGSQLNYLPRIKFRYLVVAAYIQIIISCKWKFKRLKFKYMILMHKYSVLKILDILKFKTRWFIFTSILTHHSCHFNPTIWIGGGPEWAFEGLSCHNQSCGTDTANSQHLCWPTVWAGCRQCHPNRL